MRVRRSSAKSFRRMTGRSLGAKDITCETTAQRSRLLLAPAAPEDLRSERRVQLDDLLRRGAYEVRQ